MNIKTLENRCLKPILYSVYANDLCGDTLQDLLSNMVAYLNEVIEQTNDNTRLVQGVYDFVKEQGLKDEVIKQLNIMIDNGVFENIVNEEIFGDLSSDVASINTKLNNQISNFNSHVEASNNKFSNIDEFINTTKPKLNIIEKNKEDIKVSKNKFFGGETMLSHRGAWKMAPQNSMIAFEIARHQGYKALETDIVKTLDNKFIMFHDGVVNNILNGVGEVKNLTLRQIQDMTFKSSEKNSDIFTSARVVEFEDFLRYVNGCGMYALIEFKYIPSESDMIMIRDIIIKHNMLNKIAFSAYNINTLRDVRYFFPSTLILQSKDRDITLDDIPEDVEKLKPFGFIPYIKNLTKTGANIAKSRELYLYPYDVNSFTEINKCIEYDCDGGLNDWIGRGNVDDSYVL